MAKVFFIIFTVICLNSVKAHVEFENFNNAFDTELYNSVLDEELCEAQLRYLVNNSTLLRAEFLDAGIRTPRGILKGNFVDLGNYHQCLEISANFAPSDIEGKYCMINIPMTQDDFEMPTLPEWPEGWPQWPEEWPGFPWPELLPYTRQHRDMMIDIRKVRAETAKYSFLAGTDTDSISVYIFHENATEKTVYNMRTFMEMELGVKISKLCLMAKFPLDEDRTSDDSSIDLSDQAFRLAVCLPKACTTKQFIDTVLVNTTAVGLRFTEEFCRLKNDKPFLPGDYAAMGVFGFIALITILCTIYDLYDTHILKGDPKRASTLGKCFSVYTNTRRLFTFNSTPGALECLDGIRSLAMMWVIVGHTYSTHMNANFFNRLDFYSWMTSFSAIWIISSSITVDTFFLLSGLLIVYTSVGKLRRMSLLKNIHLFYLHRLLRMFPVLAAGVFLQATLFNHLSDGPQWSTIFAYKVHNCRRYWWATLLHVQNYITPLSQCIGPTWYLAVDVQMHILSPLVLVWVLGKRRSAWIALTLAILAIMVVSTTYNYLNEFQPAPFFVPTRTNDDYLKYMQYYYVNTLTRCSPFLVGLLVGYILNVYKGKEVHIPKWLVTFGWTCSLVISAGIIYSAYPIMQMDWDSPFWDGIINSFSRPGWAACLGWLIFACTHGYGGPINWFLSLNMWKLPARISFAMYIFHFPIMHVVNATSITPTEFTVIRYFTRFLSDFTTAFIVGLIVTVLIDSPFSTLIKLSMGGGPKKQRPEKIEPRENGVNRGVEATNPAIA